MRRILFGAMLAVLGGTLVQSPAAAQSVEDFYKGKTIRIVIGYGPGTGYDFYMHVLARHMGAHIPASPSSCPSTCRVRRASR